MRRLLPPRPALGLLLLTLTVALGCPAKPTPPAGPPDTVAVRRLLGLMRDRLLVMNEVARSKWALKRPVADPQREATLLTEMAARSQALHLDPELTRRFFIAQFDAAKLLQQAHFDHWRATNHGPVPEAVTDLAELRKQIDKLNLELLQALAAAQPWLVQKTGWETLMDWAARDIVGQGIDDVIRWTALAPLTEKKTDLPPGFHPNSYPVKK